MSEVLKNTGVKLWAESDYSELWLDVFDQIAGEGGKSNLRLIDEAIGKINESMDGYTLEYSSEENRLYISKEDVKLPVSLIDSDGHVASKVDGTTITIDQNGIVKIPVDSELSNTSANPIQNKVVKDAVDKIEQKVTTNADNIKTNTQNIATNAENIAENASAISNEKTRAEKAEETLKSAIDTNKPVWDDKYTKTEIDNKFSALETNIDWKESVDTYSDIAKTYPNPDDGWTVNVKDTNYTYRYDGSAWVAISANAIPKATNELDGILSKEDHAKYDDSNSKKHEHDNKSILDKLSESTDGNLTYNSKEIKAQTDSELSNTSENPVQNKVITKKLESIETHVSNSNIHITEDEKKVVSKLGESSAGALTYNGSEIKPDVATTSKAGIVKPDGTTITADADGTLHGADTIKVDGITITRDDATKVIALAKTLQDKIGTIDNKIDENYVVNNLTTTESGFVLDARQGKALQDGLDSLNGRTTIYTAVISGTTSNDGTFYTKLSVNKVVVLNAYCRDSNLGIEVHPVTVIDGNIYVRLHSINDFLPNKTATVYVDYILR